VRVAGKDFDGVIAATDAPFGDGIVELPIPLEGALVRGPVIEDYLPVVLLVPVWEFRNLCNL
jgi:hypothetical protein